MYQLNEVILYDTEGLCKITEIASRNFCGGDTDFYILTPINKKGMTIYVPVNNKKQTDKMCRVLCPEEIYELIENVPEEKWIEDKNERKIRYKKIIHSGNRKDIIKLFKTLYIHREEQARKGRHLHLVDEQVFKNAEKILYEEFSHVLHISKEDVGPFILKHIKVKEKL